MKNLKNCLKKWSVVRMKLIDNGKELEIRELAVSYAIPRIIIGLLNMPFLILMIYSIHEGFWLGAILMGIALLQVVVWMVQTGHVDRLKLSGDKLYVRYRDTKEVFSMNKIKCLEICDTGIECIWSVIDDTDKAIYTDKSRYRVEFGEFFDAVKKQYEDKVRFKVGCSEGDLYRLFDTLGGK